MAVTGRPRRFGLIAVAHRPDAAALAEQAAGSLREHGVETWQAEALEDSVMVQRLPGTDLVICFGGDGTLIHSARLAASQDIPVVGVNFGKMGFLAEFEPDDLQGSLDPLLVPLLAGSYWVEERITLTVEHRRDGDLIAEHVAVNEAFVGRGRWNKLVRVHTWVDGQYMTTYAADGLLVATPTGSTAANLAANGPVLPPDMAALVLVPVMPFISFRNALVLAAGSRVDVEVVINPEPPLHEAILSVDGHTTAMLDAGDRVTFAVGPLRCRFARLRPRHYFHAMLVAKLQRPPIMPPLPADTPPPVDG